ncbi:MAG: hypothetical protein WCQ21_30475 [Verrucomicrobiota bacterium]
MAWLGFCLEGFAFEFEVQGRGDFTAYRRDGNVLATTEAQFVVSVRDALWTIRAQQKNEHVDYIEAGTDGTNVYVLTSIVNAVRAQEAAGEKVGPNLGTSYIIPGTVPRVHNSTIIPIVWLAYASSLYLTAATNGRLPPLDTDSPNPFNFTRTRDALLERALAEPKLPTRAVLYDDGTMAFWQEREYAPWVASPSILHKPQPYDKGYTNNIYRVTTFTNVNGLQLPLAFECSLFAPKPHGNASTELVRATYAIFHAVAISPTTERKDFRPQLPGPVDAADYRFALSAKAVPGPIRYMFKNHWLRNAEVSKLPDFEEQVARNKQVYSGFRNSGAPRTQKLSGRAQAVLLVLLATAVAPLIYAMIKRKRRALTVET